MLFASAASNISTGVDSRFSCHNFSLVSISLAAVFSSFISLWAFSFAVMLISALQFSRCSSPCCSSNSNDVRDRLMFTCEFTVAQSCQFYVKFLETSVYNDAWQFNFSAVHSTSSCSLLAGRSDRFHLPIKHWLNLKGPTQPTALEGIT